MNLVKLENITKMLKSQVDNGEVKGASAYILRDGHPIYRANVGMADEARGIKWENDTIVRLYSVSKNITSAAVMILFDRGLLDISDKVSWYLVGFKNQSVLTERGSEPVKNDVTIKNLLDMTSGCCYPDTRFAAGVETQKLYDKMAEDVNAGKPWDTVTLANEIGKLPLAFQPGEQWLYGTSADVLGAIVEVVSGKKFGDFLHMELFEPLGMRDTDFWCPPEKLNRLAENYEYKDGELVPCGWQHLGLTYLCRKKPEFESGGAGLLSTMDDMAAFGSMLLNKGVYNGRRILSENAVRYMTSPQLNEKQLQTFDWEDKQGYNYGNLMNVATDLSLTGPSAHLGEYGWGGWLGCEFVNDPEGGYTFLYFIQRCGGLGARPIRIIKQIVYGAED